MVVILGLIYLVSVGVFQHSLVTVLDEDISNNTDWYSTYTGIADDRKTALGQLLMVGYIPIVNTYLLIRYLLED